MKNSFENASSDGDADGTIKALKQVQMTLVGLGAGACITAAAPATGGVGIEDVVAFLTKAAVEYPDLRVFAVLGAHAPLFEYCPAYLDDAKTDINWTRVGGAIASATVGKSNFAGMYIDDFFAMMCTPERKRFAVRAPRGGQVPLAFYLVSRFCIGLLCGRAGYLTVKNCGFLPGQRHGSPNLPCVPMAAMDTMRAVCRRPPMYSTPLANFTE